MNSHWPLYKSPRDLNHVIVIKVHNQSLMQWPMPVILANQEVESGSIETSSGKKLLRPYLSQQKDRCGRHAYHLSYMGSMKRIEVHSGLGKNVRSY
jgi:hypothetical protein